ncbi:hypothetical protein F7725_001227 [Dissostichus mawsoni]|uniref:Uncharacterized protein n=1 Tax=Dissostichus mawsoni TaxID=36200 RepID=A0A7J5ZGM4_DISMA|nr:hypothetical protein F7725_001227 [Dissostichus mawsoni]
MTTMSVSVCRTANQQPAFQMSANQQPPSHCLPGGGEEDSDWRRAQSAWQHGDTPGPWLKPSPKTLTKVLIGSRLAFVLQSDSRLQAADNAINCCACFNASDKGEGGETRRCGSEQKAFLDDMLVEAKKNLRAQGWTTTSTGLEEAAGWTSLPEGGEEKKRDEL